MSSADARFFATADDCVGTIGVISGDPPVRKVGTNDLAVRVNHTVDEGPRPVHLCIRFINAPLGAAWTSMSTRSLTEQGKKALDPAVDRAPLKHKTTLGEPLDHIGNSTGTERTSVGCPATHRRKPIVTERRVNVRLRIASSHPPRLQHPYASA